MLWADLVDCDGKNRPTGPEISETGHADLLIKFTPHPSRLIQSAQSSPALGLFAPRVLVEVVFLYTCLFSMRLSVTNCLAPSSLKPAIVQYCTTSVSSGPAYLRDRSMISCHCFGQHVFQIFPGTPCACSPVALASVVVTTAADVAAYQQPSSCSLAVVALA